MERDWDESYATGNTRWDTGIPASRLVELVNENRLPSGRAIDIGCGTGTNVRYLATQGYDVVGIDLAGLAIEKARAAAPPDDRVELVQRDFLADGAPGGPYDLAFDRGCFHTFDDEVRRRRYADQVAACLAPGGLWVSLIGSTEGPPRDVGPPRRTAREVMNAVEPALEIVELSGFVLDADTPERTDWWLLLARPRAMPPQPSAV